MNDKCIEIGAIQAFLDGETSPEMSFKISGHVADCDKCALALADAEEESSVVFSALDREYNSMVPTQRLWSSINEAISYEKAHTSLWDKVRSSVSILFANPSLAVAASVLLVFGLFAAVWSLKPVGTSTSVAPSDVAEEQPQSNGTETAALTGSTEVIPPSSRNASNGESFEPSPSDKKIVKLRILRISNKEAIKCELSRQFLEPLSEGIRLMNIFPAKKVMCGR